MAKHYYWGITLNFCSGHTEKKEKEASQRFSNLALTSVTWQWSTLHLERWSAPSVPKRGEGYLLNSSRASVPLIPPSVFQHYSYPNIISYRFWKCWVLKTGSSVPTCTKTKAKEKEHVCVCVPMCAYIRKDFREGIYVLTNSLLLPNLLFLLLKISCEEKSSTTL